MEDKHIKHITSNGEIYASIFDISKMPEGLDFLTNDESFIQVGTWNYKKDKILDAHFIITLIEVHTEHKKLFMYYKEKLNVIYTKRTQHILALPSLNQE